MTAECFIPGAKAPEVTEPSFISQHVMIDKGLRFTITQTGDLFYQVILSREDEPEVWVAMGRFSSLGSAKSTAYRMLRLISDYAKEGYDEENA